MIAQPIFSGTEASVEDNSELGEKSCFANSKGERKRGKEMAKKKAGQRKKGKRWQHPSEKKRRKNAWRKILKKAPKMHAFFLAVPESFGGPVFRSRHLRFCFSFAGARANVFEGKKPFQRRDFLQSKSFVCLQRRYFAGRKKYQRFQRQVSFTTRCKRLTVKRKQCNSQPERKDGQFSGKKCHQIFECAW